jgi:2-polyprenyl-3-methyl-5-hydroxy-6-metoxy-1,4-benzoquinol methylase
VNPSDWTPSIQYEKVSEANRRSYRLSANRYNKTETCLVSRHHQLMLENDLDYILSIMQKDSRSNINALDACGGSGNVALKLLDRGADVTLCDISQEMISLFENKCKERNLSHYTTKCSEIGSFLANTHSKFDLIVFSSALHHIEDYTTILKIAMSRLSNNGYIYTIFDPIKYDFLTYLILRSEMIFDAALKYPSEACMIARRQVGVRFLRSRNLNKSVEYEYYAKSGIDDFSLIESLKKIGIKIVIHERYTDARYAIIRHLLSAFNRSTSFKLLLRTP